MAGNLLALDLSRESPRKAPTTFNVAWVTGSSRGLGRCIAEMLAEAGCNVIISGRNQTNLQSSGEGNSVDQTAAEIAGKYGVRCIAVCGELSDEDTVKRCLDEIHAKIGPVDYLVCAAGGGNIGTALKKDLPRDEKYHWYKLGTTTLTAKGQMVFHASWKLSQQCSNHVYDPFEPNAKYEIYASLKLTGPSYVKNSQKPDGVYLDRVVFLECEK